MINNEKYRESLERVIPQIAIRDGRVLVTGASGLIGSCIIDLLMLANENGRNFEIFALGRNADKLKKRFSAFEESNLLHFLEQDIQIPLDYSIQYDYIVHGASNADPRNYALFPAETLLINIEGAKNVLDYCKGHKSTKVIMLSSFEIYGNTGKDINVETDTGVINQNLIRSCYPESKRCMEILTRCYVDEFHVNAVIGRLCSIYGPTMTKDDSKAHAQFFRNVLRGEDIVLKSNGEQRRSYCYVLDAVTGIFSILEKGAAGMAYNISNEKSIVTIADMANIIAKFSGKKVVFKLPDDIETKGFSKPQNCILDNQKIKTLGWSGRYNIDDGLKECFEILMTL